MMIFKRHLLLIAALFLLLPGLSFAEKQAVAGKVVAGEQGYEVAVEVENWKNEPLKNVVVGVKQAPPGLINFSVTPAKLESLAAGKTVPFIVTFDVATDAVKQDFVELIFSVSADETEFDLPNPRVALAVAALPAVAGGADPDGTVEAGAGPGDGGSDTQGPYVYVLTEINVSGTGEHKKNQLGYLRRHRDAVSERLEMVRCIDCPTQITLGKTAHFELETWTRYDSEKYKCLSESKSRWPPTADFKLVDTYEEFSATAQEPMLFPSCQELGVKERLVVPEGNGAHVPYTVLDPVGLTLDKRVSLKADLSFAKQTSDSKGKDQIFSYDATYSTNGKLTKEDNEGNITVEFKNSAKPWKLSDLPGDNEIGVEIGYLYLTYSLQKKGQPEPLNTVAFATPAEFSRPHLDSTPVVVASPQPEKEKAMTVERVVPEHKVPLELNDGIGLPNLKGTDIVEAQKTFDKANCLDYPGTIKKWFAEEQEVRCECPDENKKFNYPLNRCATRGEFETADLDCSEQNATSVWDQVNQQATCDCVGNFQWNRAETTCIKKPQLQLAETDPKCAKWPNSQAYWDEKNERAVCDCVGDYEWNSPLDDACRIKKEIQLADFDCRSNSTALWDDQKQHPYCACTGDYELNNARTGCRVKADIQLAAKKCPYGTHPEWNTGQEKASCYCDEGSWDAELGRCIGEQERALAQLICPSCEEPYYDEAAQKARCRCARGCDYDSQISDRCLPIDQLARLRNQRRQEEEARNRAWEEEQQLREARDKAERRKYCEQALALLNSAVRRGAQQREIVMYQNDALGWDCPWEEYQAASAGRWGSGGGGGQTNPEKPNWSNGCWPKNNTGGAKLEWTVIDAPPYSGSNPLCSDRDGVPWFLGKRVVGIARGQRTSSGCFSNSTVKTTAKNYGNMTLCPAPGGGSVPSGSSSGRGGRGESGTDTGLPPSHSFGAPW